MDYKILFRLVWGAPNHLLLQNLIVFLLAVGYIPMYLLNISDPNVPPAKYYKMCQEALELNFKIWLRKGLRSG